MRKFGKGYSEIATFLALTERAVRYNLQLTTATPSKAPRGLKSKLSNEQFDARSLYQTVKRYIGVKQPSMSI